jgi:hypothetical protein
LSYLDAHEVVLDTIDYYEAKHSGAVQHMLKTFLQYKAILFVGCGSGLEDPNFDALEMAQRATQEPSTSALFAYSE